MYPTERILRWFLLIVAVHTFGVGLVLIVAGNTVMEFFGFPQLESRFFQMQGGFFHLLFSYIYWKASTDVNRYEYLILFVVVVKCVATVFLFSYYFFIERVIMVLLSGFVDGGMGVIIYLVFRKWKSKEYVPQ